MHYVTGKTRPLFLLGLFLISIVSCNKDSDIISEAYLNNHKTPDTKENNNSSEETPSAEVDSIAEPENPESPQIPDSTKVTYELRTAALIPSDDAYLQEGKGYNESVMRLHETIRTSYIKFNLAPIDSIGGSLKSAKLRFTVDGDAGDGKIEVYKGNGSSWTELDITSSSAPAADELLGSIQKNYVLGTTEEIELDVAPLLLEKTTLILIHQDGDDLAIGSKEHPSEISPQLLMSYEVPEGAPTLSVTEDTQSPDTPEEEVPAETPSNTAPVAKISGTPLNGTAPLTVSFNSENSTDDVGITSYSWDFKDGDSSTAPAPQHTFAEAGAYAVTLTVNDEKGLTNTATITVTVSEPLPENEGPVATANADVLVGDAPLEVSFTGSNSSDDKQITSYYWDFGTDDPSSAINPSRTFTTPGVYDVTLTVKDEEGLTDSDILTITVNTSPDGGTGGATGTYPQGSVLASSFGYNATNATYALNEAVNSSNHTIVIDKQNNDWIIEPSKFFNLRDKTIIIESGVVIRAKSGAFPGTSDRLMEFIDASNVTIEGYGATLAMNKSEYTSGEGRHALSIRGSSNLTIKGLTIRDSGGDGIYLSGSSQINYSEYITIEDVVSLNNRRQGITVVSAENVWVRNSEFSYTNGTQPEAGVNFEPNNPDERLVNINFIGCRFYNNNFAGIKIALGQLIGSSIPISINIRDSDLGNNAQSTTHSKPRTEVFLGADHTNPVKGEVLFDGVRFNGSQVGVLFSKKTAEAFTAVFRNCEATNMIQSISTPIIALEAAGTSNSLGGYVFDNFYMGYSRNEPFLRINAPSSVILENITGTFTINAPYAGAVEYNNGVDPSNGINIDLNYNHIN